MGVTMAKTKEEKLQAIHDEAMREFDAIQSALRDERLQCLQDRRFYSIAGAQWEGPLGDQFENKPKFEVNKIHLAVIRIINEYRNNRITVHFVPKDGSKADKLADTCAGLYRADEQDSNAEEALDNAFEEGVGGGFGAWRLRAVEEDEEDEDCEQQRIRIEPIFDADSSVFFDLDAKRQDKSDAKRCFIISSMSHDAYEEEYGEEVASMQKAIHQSEFDWLTPDLVFVAEYYRKEKQTVLYHWFRGLDVDGDAEEQKIADEDLTEDKLELLKATGFREVRSKRIKKTVVRKYIIDGAKVIEDCGVIAGKHIPIVPFYGKRWVIDNVERCMGHVRLCKDAQRLKNMQLSKLGEISALSTVEKPIFTPEQIAGHGHMWAEDNVRNYPYMLLNAVTDASGNPVAEGPVGYTKVAQIPPAMAALLQITEQDIQDLLGNQEAGEQLQSNVSGVAVELIQNKLDMQTFIYISNMAKAVKRSGEIWLSMAKDILVEEGRKMKTVDASGQTSSIELMRAVADAETHETTYENDLEKAEFDVSVEVGPTSSSKRAAVAKAATNMLSITADPETQQVLTSLAIMNMEGEGISEIRDFFRKKLLRIGAVKPSDDEKEELAQEMANAQPDANTVYLQAAAKAEEAKAAKAGADTVLTAAKAEETKAKTIETLTHLDRSATTHIIDVVERLSNGQGLPQENTAV